MKKYAVSGICCLVLILSAAGVYAQGFTSPGANTAPQVNSERALQIAFTRAPAGGTVIAMDWELKRVGSEWEIKIIHNQMQYDIKIDGSSGQIISYRERRYTPRQPLPSPPQNRISFERVREIVRSIYPQGTIEDIEWEYSYGRWVYEVDIRVNGRKNTVYLDSVTGSQLQRTGRGNARTWI